MTSKLNCVMLVDDNEYDNFFHERIIKKSGKVNHIVAVESGKEALNYLTNSTMEELSHPNLLFLDINMPGMNGWEFLEEYKKLSHEQQVKILVIMLTTARNEEDKARAKSIKPDIGFLTKPLTDEKFKDILSAHFPDIPT